jgi:hypothetical protein
MRFNPLKDRYRTLDHPYFPIAQALSPVIHTNSAGEGAHPEGSGGGQWGCLWKGERRVQKWRAVSPSNDGNPPDLCRQSRFARASFHIR